MDLVAGDKQSFAVFDDFLPREALAAVWNALRTERFSFVQSGVWHRAFRLTDGNPLAGAGVLYGPPAARNPKLAFPSGRPIDLVVEAILEAGEALAPWVGRQGVDWDFLSATPYLYPVGAGLSWHGDTKARSGSFVLYAHPEWHADWGGELLIGDSSGMASEESRAARENALTEYGTGAYVHPKSNRLVVIASGVQHCIKKVDVSAGSNVRGSVTGFFQKAAAGDS